MGCGLAGIGAGVDAIGTSSLPRLNHRLVQTLSIPSYSPSEQTLYPLSDHELELPETPFGSGTEADIAGKAS